MLLTWPGRESGMLQGMHRPMCCSWQSNQRHPSLIGMARGSFKFEADEYQAYQLIRITALRHLPDSLQSLRTFRRLVDKLARYLGSGLLKKMRGNYEGHYNAFLFTHEARRKNTEWPGVAW